MSGARHLPSWFWLPVGCLAAACGGGDLALPDGASAVAIEVVDGDGQQGAVGEPLAAPIVVAVTDERGEPVEGATVEFALISAGEGAGITPASARTSAEGRAQARVLLGDKVGVQTGEARVTGDTTAKTAFSALAASPENHSPTADFDWTCDQLTCQFTDASTDGDGSLTARAWRFGDGSTSEEQAPVHSYAAPGTYTVRLTVTDDGGATDQLADDVTVTGPSAPPSNQPPRAAFDIDCRDLACTFTDRSDDEDGSIQSRHWDFGDGATSTQENPSHTYASPGRYEVVLTVTDDDGATDDQTRTAEPDSPPGEPNDPPNAEFETDCRDLRCTFLDRSTDRDGRIESWQWDFGDGAGSSERNPSHVYLEPGAYEVHLVVTDNDGAADTRTLTVHPESPPPPEPNLPPDADFDVRCSRLTCSFTDRSQDDDGTVVSWQWTFGDGATSSEPNPVHSYAEKGRFDVSLTVTDDDGATDTRSRRADPK